MPPRSTEESDMGLKFEIVDLIIINDRDTDLDGRDQRPGQYTAQVFTL
jgi:hypothetical protein